jgi:Transposase IS66 family
VRLREGARRGAAGRVPDAPLSVGPRLSAMVVYLSVFQHVPVERAQALISDLTGGRRVGRVRAFLPGEGRRAGQGRGAADPHPDRRRPGGGFDETTLRSGPAGDKKYVHGAFTEPFHLGTRGLETMKEAGIPPSFAGIVVSDRYTGHYSETWQNFAGHQGCAAHPIRDFADCAEAYPDAGWPEQAQRALRGLIHAWHAAREQGLPAIPAEERNRWKPSSAAPSPSAWPPSPASPARRTRPGRSPAARCSNSAATARSTCSASPSTPASGRRTTSASAASAP